MSKAHSLSNRARVNISHDFVDNCQLSIKVKSSCVVVSLLLSFKTYLSHRLIASRKF